MKTSVATIAAFALVAASPLLMGASTTYRILTLYPENQEAAAVGHLFAHLTGERGSGDISLKMPSGEVLDGHFKVNVGGSFSEFGKSRGLDRRGGAYTGAGNPIVHGSPAAADMKGPSGVTVHCEVMNDDTQAHGSGACLFSNGAEYRVLY